MSLPSPGYAITIRAEAPATTTATGELARAVSSAGAVLTALDIVESQPDRILVDLTCNAVDASHVETIKKAIAALDGVAVHKVSDRTFLIHLGGKLSVESKVPLRHRDDLSQAYTPGVARVCQAIAAEPRDVRRLTIKHNTVAVVTDGSAVLGLGNIGAAASIPVMEGKAALFKRFGGIDAWPVCLDTQDSDEIVRIVQAMAPVYGGINLEDIAAPRCFEIERRLRSLLDIPVFHDDQHGTAIVVFAALTNALRVVEKRLDDVRIVIAGAGAAGTAIARLLLAEGASNIINFDHRGALNRNRQDLGPDRQWLATHTNQACFSGSLREALVGADVFIGVSAGGLLSGEDIGRMASGAIVFALANPDPEVDPTEARRHAAVVATGRSDEPNQINNVLVFPGVFRGLLDSGAERISMSVETAAARALASIVSDHELNPSYIIPSVFNPTVVSAVAEAVSNAVATDHDQTGEDI